MVNLWKTYCLCILEQSWAVWSSGLTVKMKKSLNGQKKMQACPRKKLQIILWSFKYFETWNFENKTTKTNLEICQTKSSWWKVPRFIPNNEKAPYHGNTEGKGLACQYLPNSLPLSLLSSFQILSHFLAHFLSQFSPLYFSPDLSPTVLLRFIANIVSQLMASH